MPRYANQTQAEQLARVAAVVNASSLHERAFGEKAQMDADRLSLAQMQFLQQRAEQQERLSIARATFTLEYRKTLSGAAAVESLSALDPRSPTYKKDRGEILAKYSEGAGTEGVKTILGEQDKNFAADQEAKKSRQAATFTGPAASTWTKTYESTGDMTFANKAAEAEQLNQTRAQKLAIDPLLDPALRAKIYDPKTGQLNTDPALLTQGEVDAQGKAAEAKLAASQVSNLEALTKTATLSSVAPEKETPAQQKTRESINFNANQAIKNATFAQMNKGSVPEAVPGTDTAAAELQSLLGGSTPAPAEPPPQ